jgi:hypothetical protein
METGGGLFDYSLTAPRLFGASLGDGQTARLGRKRAEAEAPAPARRVQAQAARYANAAALFHALGGGWWNSTDAPQLKQWDIGLMA